ncbi:uncharacterized protein LOC62_04G006095 [Vanrija pseudolonga]|uniref:Uncharacterized protein n=1 Tax=Vanrija pseudolonga TaxID=143232 RepID=A0AAF0Y9Q4_9TREE|nr:hypothetical protein LOC62_04G006095 [Vanrija pseudolonga]
MAPVYAAMEGAGDLLLFPNVQTLRLDHHDHWKPEDYAFRQYRDDRRGRTPGLPPGLPPMELALFDCPDVCIYGEFYAVEALAYLPLRNFSGSSLTVHTGSLEAITWSNMQRGWRRLVVYHTDIEGFQMTPDFKVLASPSEGYAHRTYHPTYARVGGKASPILTCPSA